MPKLVRLYIRHTLIGFAVAAIFVALLFRFDVGGLWHLVTHTEGGVLAAFLLWMFNGIVFSGVQFGIAVMNLAEKPERKGPGRGLGAGLAEPVPLRAPTARR